MKVHTIETGKFKLDGGAMYGVVPRQLWKRLNPPDENNMCTWAMRCLLIDTGDRKILVDTGIGDKQDAKFQSHFEPHGEDNLMKSLANIGYTPEDITDVFLTHFHFDHCGGAISHDVDGNPVPTFPNAVYWTNEKHLQWALHPNPREKASFLKENIVPLEEWGILKRVEVADGEEWLPGIKIKYYHGHTESMMALQINVAGQTLMYCADLLPSSGHISIPYVMAYDIRPLVTLAEKTILLEEAVTNGYVLFFEHDPVIECATVRKNERGRVILDETFLLKDIFPNS